MLKVTKYRESIVLWQVQVLCTLQGASNVAGEKCIGYETNLTNAHLQQELEVLHDP